MADIEKVLEPRASAVVEEEEESEEERFDYSDSDDQEEQNSMLTVAGSPRRIKPWSFMDTFNPKKQALAIAREIDAKRGIKLELPPKQQHQPPVSETGTAGATTGESSAQSTIRRVPSGAKAPPTGHNLRASTPVESDLETGPSNDAHDNSIGYVAGQSTPLTLAKISNGKTGDSQDEVNGLSKVSSQPVEDELLNSLRRETESLKDEISKLKAQVLEQESIHAERDKELRTVSKALEERDKEIESLKSSQHIKETQVISANEQIEELRKLLEVSEKSRIQDGVNHCNIIKDLKDEVAKKDDLLEEARKRSLDIEERLDQRREKLETTIDDLKDRMNSERETAFNELRTSIADWQRRLDDKEAKIVLIREEFESTISKVQEELSKKTDDLYNVQRELKYKCKESEGKESALNEAKNNNKELQLQYDSIKEKLRGKETDAEQLEKELKIAKSSQDELETSNRIEVQELKARIDQLETDLKRLRQVQKALQLENNQYSEELQASKEQSEELAQQLESFESSHKELQSEMTEILKKIQLTDSSNKELQSNQQLLESSKSELQNKMSAAQEDLKTANEAKNQLQVELQALKDKTESHEKDNKKRFDDISLINEQLKGEVKNLKELLDKTETGRKDVEIQIQEFSKVKEQFKQLSNKYKIAQQALSDERLAHETTTKNAQKLEEYSENLTKFIENLTLFDVHIGSIMLHTFKKDHQVTCLDPFLTAKNKDVVGFHVRSHDQKHHLLEKKIDTLNLKNLELASQIDNQWKTLVENQTREISHQKQIIHATETSLRELEKKYKELESKCDKTQNEMMAMLRQKDELIKEKVSLGDQISTLQSSAVTDEQKKIIHLVEQIEDVTTTISEIREQIKLESAENGRLKTTIENQQKQLTSLKTKCEEQEVALETLHDLEKLLMSKSEDLASLKEVCDKYRAELEEKTRRLRTVEGDFSRKITLEIARQSRPDITKELYDKLMISRVDSIDMVELQNIVKNLILLLEIPFNKLTKKGPLVAIYLKYERPIFSHFANRLHFDLFNEAIDMKRFTNEAFDQYTDSHNMAAIKHPLEACLENLYQRLVSRL